MDNPSESSTSEIVRDNDFYQESGDCVVVVGGTMFKIHRYRLASDGSAFGDMFSLPNGENSPNATTEDDPIILQDSVSEFRALFWALYALPLEIVAQESIHSFQPNFKRVLDLLSISHKYHFESLETWAKRLLVNHCTPCTNADGSNPILDSPSCKTTDLELILRLATRTGNLVALSYAAQNALIRRLEKFSVVTSLARILALAEELKMRKFQGRLYYRELVKREAAASIMQPSYCLFTFQLTEMQSLALFRGYWSLSHHWKALPQTIRSKPLPRLTLCTISAHGQCQATWNHIWSVDNFNRNVDPPPHDFGPLGKLEKILSTSTLAPSSGPQQVSLTPCGLSELGQIIKQFRDSLADHFLGPQAPAQV